MLTLPAQKLEYGCFADNSSGVMQLFGSIWFFNGFVEICMFYAEIISSPHLYPSIYAWRVDLYYTHIYPQTKHALFVQIHNHTNVFIRLLQAKQEEI